MISNKIISFLAQVSFTDIYIFKTVLLPFLFELVSGDKERFTQLDCLIKYIFIILDKKQERQEFITKLFECKC